MENKLDNVPEGKEFVLLSGEKIKNLEELYSLLPRMDPKVFGHHVTKDRNDFSDWVRGVHKDYVLANSLNPFQSKDSVLRAVADHIYSLRKAIEVPAQGNLVKESAIAEDSLEILVTDVKSEVGRTLVLPEGGEELVEFADEPKVSDDIKKKSRRIRQFIDLPGFKKDMKIVFGRKSKDHKKHIDDLKRVCMNDEE